MTVRSTYLAVGFLSLPLVLAAACGGASTLPGGGGGSPVETLDEACAEIARADCDNWRRCSPALMEVDNPDQDTCEAREKIWCTGAYGRSDVSASPDDVLACGKAFAGAAACSAPIDLSACELEGTAPVGAGCYYHPDCATGFCWYDMSCFDDGTCPYPRCGTCVARKQVGEACKPDQCDAGLFCAGTGRCETLAATGEACPDSSGCTAGNCVDGTCQPSRRLGESCDVEKGVFCDPNALLSCDATNHCVGPRIVGKGADCGGDPKTFVVPFCGAGLYCDGGYHCAETAADGASCSVDASGFDDCTYPATCQGGRCSTTPPACR